MNVEKLSEPPNENHQRWRVVLQNFFFFSSGMIAWMAVSKLHSDGQQVSWILIPGVLEGSTFAALMYRYQRLK
jgi:hypothetical protein